MAFEGDTDGLMYNDDCEPFEIAKDTTNEIQADDRLVQREGNITSRTTEIYQNPRSLHAQFLSMNTDDDF